ncbi:MAG TPA: HAD hydrolase family protein [Clostridia bacterium]
MIKLIVTDLDNTLLRSDKTISGYTASVLKKCQDRGILIVLSFIRHTGEDLYSIGVRSVSKWNAVRAVAGHYGIDTDIIAAFGNDMDDLEMVRNCGIGVAVRNAVEEVKGAAGYICGSNDDDGVAKWIEEHILTVECGER